MLWGRLSTLPSALSPSLSQRRCVTLPRSCTTTSFFLSYSPLSLLHHEDTNAHRSPPPERRLCTLSSSTFLNSSSSDRGDTSFPSTSFLLLLSSSWCLPPHTRRGVSHSSWAASRRLTPLGGHRGSSSLQTAVVAYSSLAVGGFACTRVCRGSGALRQSASSAAPHSTADASAAAMELNGESPAKRRRGRPPGSLNKKPSSRKAAAPAVKKSATAARHGGRRPRGVAAAAAAASAMAAGSAAAADDPSSPRQTPHSFPQGERITSDKDINSNDSEDDAQEAELYSGRYELSSEDTCAQTSARLGLPLFAVRFVLSQAKDGATVPFLARYRQGETGRMDETQLRQVLDTAKEVREVHRRRQFMLRSLEERGLLTPALQAALSSMVHMSQLEDAWEPYKERRTSLASRGRAEGLGRYASALLHLDPRDEEAVALLAELRAAVSRVEDGERLLLAILAEDVQRSEGVRQRLGDYCRRTTRLSCAMVAKPRKKVAKDLQEENFERLKKHFAFYDGKSWSVDRIAAHVVLALQRGEAKGVLKVEAAAGPKSHGVFMHAARDAFPSIVHLLPAASGGSGGSGGGDTRALESLRDVGYCRHLLSAGLQAAYDYLLKQLSTAVRRDLKKSAEQEAIAVFAHNLHHMLLQRPLSHSRILAMDPGHTHGVKCVVLDESGNVETFFTCTLMDEAKMRQYVTQVVESRRLNKIVIGNGTASGETSELVADLIKKRKWTEVEFAVVSEAGASVYSVSDTAKEEFPTLGVMYRGAVSIGRRVLDPLSELVKIPVRSMGIGMYQHDVNEKELMRELGYVLESCVAKVGINAASANRYVMEKVPGIQKKIVDQIVLARHAKRLHSRDDLRRVPAMTESVYEQIAGFFRFPNSPEPLDNTNIHPESYPLVRQLVALYAAGRLTPKTTTAAASPAAASGAASEAPPPSSPSPSSSACQTVSAQVGDAATRREVAVALQRMSPAQLAALAATELACTVETLELVAAELLNPGLDPRASLPHAGLLRREVCDVHSLQKGQVLSGVVQSVTMFGAFVDCGLHDSVLVRGDGVDTLQVGAYLDKRIRFDALDHLQRPRMTLLPSAEEKASSPATAGGGWGRQHRLRLESEDVVTAVASHGSGAAEPAGPAVAAGAAGGVALTSLSATIERERRRRAEAERAGPTAPASPSMEEEDRRERGREEEEREGQGKSEGDTDHHHHPHHHQDPIGGEMEAGPPPTLFALDPAVPQRRAAPAQRGRKRHRSPSPDDRQPSEPHVTVQPLDPPSSARASAVWMHKKSSSSGAVRPSPIPPSLTPASALAAGAEPAKYMTPRTVPVEAPTLMNPASAAMSASVQQHTVLASQKRRSVPTTVDVDEVDVDAESVATASSTSSSDVVFSF